MLVQPRAVEGHVVWWVAVYIGLPCSPVGTYQMLLSSPDILKLVDPDHSIWLVEAESSKPLL